MRVLLARTIQKMFMRKLFSVMVAGAFFAAFLGVTAKGYRGDGEIPELDENVWNEAIQLYITAYEKLTKSKFVSGEYPVEERIVKNLKKAGLM